MTRRLAILDSFGICVLEVCYSQIIWNKDQHHDYHRRATYEDHSKGPTTPEVESTEDADANAHDKMLPGSSRKRKWETWNIL